MKQVAFSIFDTVAKAYGTPFFSPSEPMAIRTFKDLTNDPQSTINKNPEDFQLFRVGEFVNIEGTLIQEEIPQLMAKAIDVINKKE